VLRKIWSDSHTLVEGFLRGLPDWVRWQLTQWQRQTDTVVRPAASNLSSAQLRIILVSYYTTAREFKLAYAARLCGHHVTLVTRHIGPPPMVAQHFDACYEASNPWRILILLDKLRPDVIHLLAHGDNILMLPVLLHAPSPVVYDPYDCLQGMIKPKYQVSRMEREAERICFARADYICARSIEPLYLRRHFGYRMPATIYFPEYCWRPPQAREPRQFHDDEELHVAYCGGIWPEDRYPAAECGYAQYIEVGRALARQRIHLHLYPSKVGGGTNYEDFFSLYLEESKHNPFFHIYRPLPYTELLRELPQYDAAIHIMGVKINQAFGSATRAKLDYSSANKLFDYIEVGLPVIIHDGKHQRGVVRHYGSSVEVSDIARVREVLLSFLSQNRPSKSSAAIADHVERLDRMYRSVAKLCESSS